MTKHEIVEALAQDRVVENMALNIAHSGTLTPDLQDLCQGVYLILLEYDEAKVQDLYQNSALDFFIARILANQYLSKSSPFYNLFRRFRSMCDELNPVAYDEDDDEQPPPRRR